MSYRAYGSGSATLKKDANLTELKTKLHGFDFDTEIVEEFHALDFTDDGNYHEDDTYDFLNAIIPYIESGSMEYTGDEDCYWRFLFNPEEQKWLEENGSIQYGNPDLKEVSDEDLMEELKKRGYNVYKPVKKLYY